MYLFLKWIKNVPFLNTLNKTSLMKCIYGNNKKNNIIIYLYYLSIIQSFDFLNIWFLVFGIINK